MMELPPTSTTIASPGSASSDVQPAATQLVAKTRSSSSSWKSGDVYASGISVVASETGSRVCRYVSSDSYASRGNPRCLPVDGGPCGPLIVLSGVTIPSAAATASSIVLIHLRDDI